LAPNCRLVADDAGYVAMQSVYEDWCRRNKVMKEDPILFQIEKLRALNPVSFASHLNLVQCAETNQFEQKSVDHMNAIRLETFLAINETKVPSTVVLEYFQATYPSYADFWLFRRTFGYQLAALTFITYVLFMNSRNPGKLFISRSNGKVWGTELVPMMAAQKPLFNNPEAVPFRLTPNMQILLGPIVTEGIFAPSLMAIARALHNPNDENGGDMAAQLSVFVRDEVAFWYSAQRQHSIVPTDNLREAVAANCEFVVRRMKSLAEEPKVGNLPANQTVVDLVASSVNPRNLSQMDLLWCPWL